MVRNFSCVTNFANTITIAESLNNVHETAYFICVSGVYKCPNTLVKIVVSRASFYDFQRVISFASDFEKIRYSSFRVSIFPLYLFKFALPFLTLCTCNRLVASLFPTSRNL